MTHLECIALIVKFKTIMIKSNLCDCTGAYILIKGKISFVGQATGRAARQAEE